MLLSRRMLVHIVLGGGQIPDRESTFNRRMFAGLCMHSHIFLKGRLASSELGCDFHMKSYPGFRGFRTLPATKAHYATLDACKTVASLSQPCLPIKVSIF